VEFFGGKLKKESSKMASYQGRPFPDIAALAAAAGSLVTPPR
jgi:hypothetical protein